MRRFVQNRWLAFILALSVLISGSATLASPSFGGGPDPIVFGGGEGGGSDPGGDPDGPAGPSKRGPYKGSVAPGGRGYASTPVGDGSATFSVWSWRYHVVLRSLISRYFRF